mmetsp:Transcript_22838/g.22089  ORF Transcript_22838/g.22089 Transcript_22838/m.22089 type:complete len:260 (+) Transcript_22838:1065-1844(+)
MVLFFHQEDPFFLNAGSFLLQGLLLFSEPVFLDLAPHQLLFLLLHLLIHGPVFIKEPLLDELSLLGIELQLFSFLIESKGVFLVQVLPLLFIAKALVLLARDPLLYFRELLHLLQLLCTLLHRVPHVLVQLLFQPLDDVFILLGAALHLLFLPTLPSLPHLLVGGSFRSCLHRLPSRRVQVAFLETSRIHLQSLIELFVPLLRLLLFLPLDPLVHVDLWKLQMLLLFLTLFALFLRIVNLGNLFGLILFFNFLRFRLFK